MANPIVLAVDYSGSTVQGTFTTDVQCVAYLWGGGGGAGGNDRGSGGNGQGSGYAQVTFNAVAGQTLMLAVGGRGLPGQNGAAVAGGTAGGSYSINPIVWSTLQLPGVLRNSNPGWCEFLNTYGVYNPEFSTYTWYTSFTAPTSGWYTVTGSSDDYASITIDGTYTVNVRGYTSTYSGTFFLYAGLHTVTLSLENLWGPYAIGATISQSEVVPVSYSGAQGGASGPTGRSGSGGGGGGATVLILNGSLIGAAGGGGGAGGGGNRSIINGENAPGSRGLGGPGQTNGETGQSVPGDGGGGGGGAGGYRGGNGGAYRENVYDGGGLAGVGGSSLGTFTLQTYDQTPAGEGTPYWNSAYGRGGLANVYDSTNGRAVLEFYTGSVSVKDAGIWQSVQNTWIKNGGVWNQVKATYVKTGGAWKNLSRIAPISFSPVSGKFGVQSRVFVPPPPPPVESGTGSSGDYF